MEYNPINEFLGKLRKTPNVSEPEFSVDPVTQQVTLKPGRINNRMGASISGEDKEITRINREMMLKKAEIDARRYETNKPTKDAENLAKTQHMLNYLDKRNQPLNDTTIAEYSKSDEYNEFNKSFKKRILSGDAATTSGNEASTAANNLQRAIIGKAQNKANNDEALMDELATQGVLSPFLQRGERTVRPGDTVANQHGIGVKSLFMGSTQEEEEIGRNPFTGEPITKRTTTPGQPTFTDMSKIKREEPPPPPDIGELDPRSFTDRLGLNTAEAPNISFSANPFLGANVGLTDAAYRQNESIIDEIKRRILKPAATPREYIGGSTIPKDLWGLTNLFKPSDVNNN